MSIFRPLYPIFRRNSTFILFIVGAGLSFDFVFNRGTRYLFYDVMNKGNGFNYLEPKIMQMKAAAEDEDDE
ncbi:unnamed protein product [Clavelina lepadiformis]|uniref:Complex III subunit 9 n=1 Tax=Clavelina lepadiformis TaxID=159417 RepID=A0ABP0GS10_CLALP